jgi:hypothetical protein
MQLRQKHWAVALLVGILIFGNLGLSQATFAQQPETRPNDASHMVFTGEGPPPDKLGKIGNLYFDSKNELISYVKIANDEWELRGVVGMGDIDGEA